MSRLAISLGLWPWALAVCLLGGCGPSGPVRHEVTGKVVYKGQPLDEGLIDFFPLDGQGSKSGAGIQNGAYQIPRDKGLFPGRYRVEILGGSGPTTSEKIEAPGPRPAGPRGKVGERIPPEYNSQSKQIIEVKAEGPNEFNFNIP
jgi:hypothetical protein